MLSSFQDVAARRFSQMIIYRCYQCWEKKQTTKKSPWNIQLEKPHAEKKNQQALTNT